MRRKFVAPGGHVRQGTLRPFDRYGYLGDGGRELVGVL
jgi:hypothetical protein